MGSFYPEDTDGPLHMLISVCGLMQVRLVTFCGPRSLSFDLAQQVDKVRPTHPLLSRWDQLPCMNPLHSGAKV